MRRWISKSNTECYYNYNINTPFHFWKYEINQMNQSQSLSTHQNIFHLFNCILMNLLILTILLSCFSNGIFAFKNHFNSIFPLICLQLIGTILWNLLFPFIQNKSNWKTRLQSLGIGCCTFFPFISQYLYGENISGIFGILFYISLFSTIDDILDNQLKTNLYRYKRLFTPRLRFPPTKTLNYTLGYAIFGSTYTYFICGVCCFFFSGTLIKYCFSKVLILVHLIHAFASVIWICYQTKV